MKGWLTRAAVNSVRRGRPPVIPSWMGWLGRSSSVDGSRFQGPGDPYPGHWRRPPSGRGDGLVTSARLRMGLQNLPDLWRDVLWARDGERRRPEQVAERFGLTVDQQQRILLHARAAVLAWLEERRDQRGPS